MLQSASSKLGFHIFKENDMVCSDSQLNIPIYIYLLCSIASARTFLSVFSVQKILPNNF